MEKKKVNKELIELHNEYKFQLLKVSAETLEKIKVEFRKFKEKYRPDYIQNVPSVHDVYYEINNVKITIADLLLLVGNFHLFPPHDIFSWGYFGADEEKRREYIIKYENFLKAVPGIKMPARPEKVDLWLNGKENWWI